MTSELITPVILCGGGGTRLWPVSRKAFPKQFLKLFGQASTLQGALLRVSDPALFAKPIVVTNEDYRFHVREQLEAINLTADILLEPLGRDSGPAIAAATLLAARRDPAGLVLVCASDHVIPDS